MTKKILVVDDELQTVKLIGMLLQRRGYEIFAATLGSQGLAKAQSEKPDLIVLDVMMPDMNGYEVCRQLRANPATAGIPIIMFTAKTMIDDKVTGFQAGADDYLTKPVHPDELASRVEALLARVTRTEVEQHPLVQAKVLGFLGAKGGVGTTTLAVNVAVSLAQQSDSDGQVVLADLQSGMAASSLQLGLQRHGRIVKLLDQPLDDIDASVVEAQLDEHRTGVRLLTGQIEPPGVAMSVPPAHAELILRRLGAMADYLLLDLGVGLGEVNRCVLPSCDHVVLAIEPNHVALMLAQVVLNELTMTLNLPMHRISVIMVKKTRSAVALSKHTLEDLLQHDIADIVPPAPELAFQAAEKGVPMVVMQPDSLVARQFGTIAEHLAQV